MTITAEPAFPLMVPVPPQEKLPPAANVSVFALRFSAPEFNTSGPFSVGDTLNVTLFALSIISPPVPKNPAGNSEPVVCKAVP